MGVFASSKTQQFQAIAVFNDGSEEDYTTKVGWSIGAKPLPGQDLKPHQIAKIDKNGKATVLSTWGRVKVIATYPPPRTFSPNMITPLLLRTPEPLVEEPPPPTEFLPAVYSLLLNGNQSVVLLPAIDELSVQSDNGPLEGGNIVVITGSTISNNQENDIVSVKLNGVEAEVLWSGKDTVYVQAGPAQVSGTGRVEVKSRSQGVHAKTDGYTYNPSGDIEQWAALQNTLLIKGKNLGNGNDIHTVKVFGINAEIVDQDASSVYIRTSAGGKGNIEIFSHSHGVTIKNNVSLATPFPGFDCIADPAATLSRYTGQGNNRENYVRQMEF